MPGTEVELVRGSGGCFEVTVGETLVFSKLELGRFPAYAEVPKLLGC